MDTGLQNARKSNSDMSALINNTLIPVQFLTGLGLSVHTILEYYAILCLALTPLTLMTTIILARRTTLFDRIDNFLDRILPPNPKGRTATDDEKKDIIKNSIPEQQVREMSGISTFEIQVGEKYQCHLNYQNRGGSYGEMVWFSENDFVGRVNERGLFVGSKAGLCNIYCVGKGNAYESGVQAYCIKVVPRLQNWFGDTLIELVSSKRSRMDMLACNIKRKIIREDPKSNLIVYAGLPYEISSTIALQFDDAGNLLRGAYKIRNEAELTDKVIKALEERFEKIETSGPENVKVFIHQFADKSHEEVDLYATVTEEGDTLYLAVGQTWRDYGEKEEFIDNINLAVKLFKDIVPGIGNSEIKAIVKEESDTSDTGNKDKTEPGEDKATESEGGKPVEETGSATEMADDSSEKTDTEESEHRAGEEEHSEDGESKTGYVDFASGDDGSVEDFDIVNEENEGGMDYDSE